MSRVTAALIHSLTALACAAILAVAIQPAILLSLLFFYPEWWREIQDFVAQIE